MQRSNEALYGAAALPKSRSLALEIGGALLVLKA